MANINKSQAAMVLNQNHMRKPNATTETWKGVPYFPLCFYYSNWPYAVIGVTCDTLDVFSQVVMCWV